MKYSKNYQDSNQILMQMMEEFQDEERIHPSVTDLIYCLTKSAWNSSPSEIKPSPKTMTYFVIGLGLEKSLLGSRQNSISGSFDGISYHVDDFDSERGLVREIKSTRMGVKTTPETFPEGWIKQTQAYCHALQVCNTQFTVIHLREAEINTWDLEYTQVELDNNWSYLADRRDQWLMAVNNGIVPTPYKYCMEWECKNCVYALRCAAGQRSLDAT